VSRVTQWHHKRYALGLKPLKKVMLGYCRQRMVTTRTRSGRTVKEPVRYEPVEKVVDDFAEDEYDSDVDLDASDDEASLVGEDSDEEESEDDEEDADENGNLKDFVAYSEDEEEDSDYEEGDSEEELEDSEEDTDDEEDEEEETESDEEDDGPVLSRPPSPRTPVARREVSPAAAEQDDKSVTTE
jgi:hypothetical protein